MGTPSPATRAASLLQRRALTFVVLMGLVSLCADMVYEGARSVSGPYLALLGASGAAVGIAAGAGELIGYGLRLVFGYLSDSTRRYWAFTIAGYALSALVVPALALAGSWPLAVALLTLERVSKALRSPAKDTLLSHATAAIGHGKGFGLHEVLDQIGAVAAPLLLAAVIAWRGDYQLAFALLLVPGVLSVAGLFLARARYPQPADLVGKTPSFTVRGFPRAFWLYLAAVGLIAAGYVDFPLIAFHLERATVVASATIPTLYALASATVFALAVLHRSRRGAASGDDRLAGARPGELSHWPCPGRAVSCAAGRPPGDRPKRAPEWPRDRCDSCGLRQNEDRGPRTLSVPTPHRWGGWCGGDRVCPSGDRCLGHLCHA